MSILRSVALVAAILGTPAISQAQQGPPDRSALSIYGGVGELTLARSDLEARRVIGGEAGLRFPLSERLRVDVSVGQFRNHISATYLDVPISSPTALLGRADRLEQRTDRSTSVAEVVVLATGGAGRVRLGGGGGVGVMVLRRTSRQAFSGCSAGVSGFCDGGTRTDFSSTSGTAVGLGTVDLRLTRRVSVYGGGRFALVLRDVSSSGVRVTGGIRVGF
jgi:hypothetical protein